MNRKSYIYCPSDNSYTQIQVSQNSSSNDVDTTWKYNDAKGSLKDSSRPVIRLLNVQMYTASK